MRVSILVLLVAFVLTGSPRADIPQVIRGARDVHENMTFVSESRVLSGSAMTS